MLNLRCKYFFILKFRFIFFRYKYLGFLKLNSISNSDNNIKNKLIISSNAIGFLQIKSRDLVSLFYYNNFLNFIKTNHYLLYFNDYSLYKDLFKNFKNYLLFGFSFSGFFLNNNYLKNLNNYYLFYSNNFKIYIYIFFKLIYILINILYIFILKLLKLLILFNLKNEKK